ncbi:dnaJ homolog subfamily C member 1-like [Centruroides sculpturatus]|uniref:dnaJ homolog subfamily C member 1-like n=1 Tax=Centruroides sculpturatus TaxID=218467 RepID=UPI000C6E534F|nr:dnaJ homolog subfamily C member 1-like [Centruroides sculpturatus]
MNKYPGGTTLRWEKIAQMLSRSVEDVTTFAKRLKTSTIVTHAHHSLQGVTGLEEATLPQSFGNITFDGKQEEEKPPKRKNAKESTNATKQSCDKEIDNWTQQQQKSLELALQQFPKGTEERWEKIAENVIGKSKEECMLRYKHLVELVKRKKSSTTS